MSNIEYTTELDNPLSSSKIGSVSGFIKVSFYKNHLLCRNIPILDINDSLRTVICNSKIKISPYNISEIGGVFKIIMPSNIKGNLGNLIIVKALTTIGLKYKCSSCKMEVEGIEKTICFHY
jgi:hypothetical protein